MMKMVTILPYIGLDNVAVTRDAEHQNHNNTDFSFVDNSNALNLANAVTQDTEHYDQPLVHVSLMQPSQCFSKSEEEGNVVVRFLQYGCGCQKS